MTDKKNKQNYNNEDLFNNPMVKSAMSGMSLEEREHYKLIGKEMYGSINFEDNQIMNNLPPPMKEAAAYIERSIKDGQHISFLEKEEKQLMQEVHGVEWYKRYGFVKDDLEKIVTLK